jgi:tetratricopeptide (TPR) repeat protein
MTILVSRAAAFFSLFFALVPAVAKAGDIEDFETARSAYEARDYERAVIYFEALVGGDVPRLASLALVAEARKYLGAAYLFVGRRDAARQQFERLLREEPDYILDPLRFPIDVQELFDSVRERLTLERQQAQERAALEERATRAEERARALVDFAEEEVTIAVPNSRWLALFPFGVGQFENGDDGLGWAFLLSEAVLAGTAIGAMIWWQDLSIFANRAQLAGDASSIREANQLLEAAFVLHWSAIGTLSAMVIAGIVEAQIRFVPARTVRERRQVPEALRESRSADLRVGVGVGTLSLSFRF